MSKKVFVKIRRERKKKTKKKSSFRNTTLREKMSHHRCKKKTCRTLGGLKKCKYSFAYINDLDYFAFGEPIIPKTVTDTQNLVKQINV